MAILFAGNGIHREKNHDKASIVDISPTIAHLMGFPINTDDGISLDVVK